MQDSDDDYYSDFTLDEQTLAFLVEEESKFVRNTQSTTLPLDTSPPPKRQKIAASWRPVRPIQRHESVDDVEDLPDISVQMDGTYTLQDRQRPTTGPSNQPQIVRTISTLHSQSQGESNLAVPPPRGAAPPFRARSVTTPSRGTSLPSRPPPSTRAVRAPTPILSQSVARSQSGPRLRLNESVTSGVSDALLADLRHQVEELRKSNEKMQSALQRAQGDLRSALDAKFAKEGEVTILRKGIKKTAEDHTAQIARLKAAKEEADSKQLILQKQFEADVERIKTEFTFKQHELESHRRPLGSVHPNKTVMGPPSTPVPVPSQISAWGQSGGNTGPSILGPDSPRRPRFGEVPRFERPKKPVSADNRSLPSGFQTSSPIRPQYDGYIRGKGKAVAMESISPPMTPVKSAHPSQHPPPSFPSVVHQPKISQKEQIDVSVVQMEEQGGSGDFAPIDVDIPVDVDIEGANLILANVEEEVERVEPLNWTIVLHRVILTHNAEGSKISTFQLLMTVTWLDPGLAGLYNDALSVILDVLANIPNHPDRDFDRIAKTVCEAFCNMAATLATISTISSLAALFDLLTNLTYTIPSFHTLLLSSRVSEEDDTPRILYTLCRVIKDELHSLTVTNEEQNGNLSMLGKHTLSLLEAIAQNGTGDVETALSSVPRSPSVLTALLEPSRPQWFLLASVRCLAWLSTVRSLFRSLLSFPESHPESKGGGSPDSTNLPQIDLLCMLLADPDRKSLEADKMKNWIVMFFGMLSISHPDAFTTLVESPTLIPSTILRLSQLADRIWEVEEPEDCNPRVIPETITMMVQAIRFLHHLVDGNINLRERLHRAPMRKFNGLIHRFIETFGRLSYADRPDWISGEDKQAWEKVSDMARSLLGLVVEGPEADLVWSTYQTEVDDGCDIKMEMDEEDIGTDFK